MTTSAGPQTTASMDSESDPTLVISDEEEAANNNDIHNSSVSVVFQCSKCTKTFKNKNLLKAHEKRHIPAECFVCKQSFTNDSCLKRHYRSHENRKIECGKCGTDFNNINDVYTHLVESHKVDNTQNLEKSYICDTCNSEFHTEVFIRKHLVECNKETGILKYKMVVGSIRN
jgi:DNA-directed RNA polymerase subunit RPC12/RpoP